MRLCHPYKRGQYFPWLHLHFGDLNWLLQLVFVFRTAGSRFDQQSFWKHAMSAQVKMFEVKLLQGFKPSYGGVLPKSQLPFVLSSRGCPHGRELHAACTVFVFFFAA